VFGAQRFLSWLFSSSVLSSVGFCGFAAGCLSAVVIVASVLLSIVAALPVLVLCMGLGCGFGGSALLTRSLRRSAPGSSPVGIADSCLRV